jgi:hypothetical protein
MNKFIELYGEEESEETLTISIKEAKEREEIFDLEKYPAMEMKVKKTSYKIVLD